MKNSLLKVTILLLMVLSIRLAYGQTSLYVSPAGDGNQFSEKNPGNIEELTAKLQDVRSKTRGTINVYVNGGEYFLQKPLEITQLHTGDKKDTLNICGMQGSKAVLSGGRKITSWEESANGIYRSKLPAGSNFRQLYVNGKMAVRSRTPNRENEQDFGPYFRAIGFDEKNQTLKIRKSEIQSLKNREGVELVIHQHWYQSRILIESLQYLKDTAIITPNQPARKNLFQLTYARLLGPDKPYYLENSLEFLDQGGEWYLDTKENYLYYKPVHNLALKNLVITGSNWTQPSRDGIIATQAVQGKRYPGSAETGIISAEFARNFLLENAVVTGSGNHGVVFRKGVKESQVRLCHIDQISANGSSLIPITEIPHDTLFCTNNRIADNLIENIGMHYTNGMGLIASCVAGLVVENNEIRFGRYSGMQIGNHYGDNLSGMRDNLIQRNDIHHVMQLHDDGGAIYTLALQPGTKIIQNWMHNFGRGIWADNFPVNGVFLDNNSGYIRVQDNVFTDLNTVDRIKEQNAGNTQTRDNALVNNNTQNPEVKRNSGIRGKAGLKE